MKVFGLCLFKPKITSKRHFKRLGFNVDYSGYFPLMHEICLSKGNEHIYFMKKKIRQHVLFIDGFRNGIEIIYPLKK